jgi:hypothetical protein
MPTPVKIYHVGYGLDTLDPKVVEAASGAAGKSGFDRFKLQSNHLGAVVEKGILDLTKANKDDFGAGKKTLAVFSAPEFFFKDAGGKPYPRDAFFNGLEYLKTKLMSLGTNLIVLPGTIWWWESATKNPKDQSERVTVHNTLPIFSNKKYIHTWQKENLSDIDGLNETSEKWDRDNKAVAAVLDDSQVPVFEYTVEGTKLKVGVEVCLDHDASLAVLKKKGGSNIDLHILIACGMDPNVTSIAARSGGVFLRCDGHPEDVKATSCVQSGQATAAWKLTDVKTGTTTAAPGGKGKIYVSGALTIQTK